MSVRPFSPLLLLGLLALGACRSAKEDTGPEVADADGDGHQSSEDCDDANPEVHPGAEERCNGIDDDCDGFVDAEDPSVVDATNWYVDTDGDGWGDDALSELACEASEGWVDRAGDCEPDDPTIHPEAPEEDCTDPTDYDCDGVTAYADEDGDGWAACEDCDDANPEVHPGADELCDGIDNDCDGTVDDDDAIDARTWFQDDDEDGYGVTDSSTAACEQPPGYAARDGDCDDGDPSYNPGASEDDCTDPNDYNCDGSVGWADEDGDGWAACEDCDDTDAGANPDQDEVCDGADNDCDGSVDEDDAVDAPSWYIDYDGDGYGSRSYALQACEQPSGYVASSSDCDDTDPSAHPGGSEVCDGADNDCDGTVDEADAADATTWYPDADGDGYGSGGATAACAQPSGHAASDGDCDEGEPAINPGATEVCNGVDDDCDGSVDVGPADGTMWYTDGDGDGYGDTSSAVESCSQPSGDAVLEPGDCDDADGGVHPAATELCDGVDNDCDGSVDEADAADATTWYIDYDSDGYGSDAYTLTACDEPSGYAADDSDCDDTDPSVHPGAPETTVGVDSNCDGVVEHPGPVAVASFDDPGDVYTCDEIALDASGSYDPDGDPILTWSWTLESAPASSVRDSADIVEPDEELPVFVPDEAGDYTFGLVVSDGLNDSAMDSIIVRVLDRGYNSPPTAEAGGSPSYSDSVTCTTTAYGTKCDDCSTVVFALNGGASSDPDGDPLAYRWTVIAGDSYASLSSADSATPSLVVSGVPATYGTVTTELIEVEPQVEDREGEADSDTLTVTFACEGV